MPFFLKGKLHQWWNRKKLLCGLSRKESREGEPSRAQAPGSASYPCSSDGWDVVGMRRDRENQEGSWAGAKRWQGDIKKEWYLIVVNNGKPHTGFGN